MKAAAVARRKSGAGQDDKRAEVTASSVQGWACSPQSYYHEIKAV